MNKPLIGLIIKTVLKMFDKLSTLVSTPEVAPQIVKIVIGSTFKKMIVGLIAGFVARKVDSVPVGVAVGLAAKLALAFLVAAMPNPSSAYYWRSYSQGASPARSWAGRRRVRPTSSSAGPEGGARVASVSSRSGPFLLGRARRRTSGGPGLLRGLFGWEPQTSRSARRGLYVAQAGRSRRRRGLHAAF
jgi:hypothetical protein